MNPSNSNAERCLVSTCAHLCMTTIHNENFSMWLAILSDVLPDCRKCREQVISVREAAQYLVDNPTGMSGRNAMTRLQIETRAYYAKAAGQYFEVWGFERRQEVIE